MSTTKLANKLSSLLRQAVADLRAIEKNKVYTVDMDRFHYPALGFNKTARTCHVCLAGAVMARTLGANPKARMDPFEYSRDTEAKLNALDALRRGQITEAMRKIGDFTRTFRDVDVIEYSEGPELFKEQMEELAEHLRLVGL